MIRRIRLLIVLLFFATAAATLAASQAGGSGGTNRPEHRNKPYVILVSLDGFKAEYLDRFELPNLQRVMERGARAKAMVPVFPSLTFPNHYSLVTGLHPGRHGIVNNRFYDPELKRTYAYTDPNEVTDGVWYRGEPIWVTAEKQGMVSACFFWPGSEAPVQGVRPTIWNKYDGTIPNAARVKTVLDWLQLPEERRPHVITLYFSELDSASHETHLEDERIEQAARSLDGAIGQLLDGIDALPIRDRVYLVITSDHGMANTSAAQTVRLESLLDPADFDDIVASFGGPVASLHVKGGLSRARELVERINAKLARGRAYLRTEMPDRFQYHRDPRAGDIVVVMDASWVLSTSRTSSAAAAKTGRGGGYRGYHGWDNAYPSMRAAFLVMGPDIRPGALVGEVHNVDVYPFLTEILGIEAAPDIDGRAGAIGSVVRRTPEF
jgi:predicted AlkP superfamily pyrophosphatase or phosphodiesterase